MLAATTHRQLAEYVRSLYRFLLSKKGPYNLYTFCFSLSPVFSILKAYVTRYIYNFYIILQFPKRICHIISKLLDCDR